MLPERGIVSPCSSCKNKRDQPANGLPACPRLQQRSYAANLQNSGQSIPEALTPALLTGTEGTPQEGTDALRNPVYSDSDHHILVWVAALNDNSGSYSPDGKLLSPHILDQNFDTNFIQCRPMPYFVEETEASYFMKGAWRENDMVVLQEGERDQMTMTQGQETVFDPIRVSGSVRKVDFPFRYNRKHVPKDLVPRGT